MAHGYAPFPPANQPPWKEGKEVRKAIARTKVLILRISPKSPVFVSRKRDAKAASAASASGFMAA